MRIFRRTILVILFIVGFILLISESETLGDFLLSKGIAVACAIVFYLLWKRWHMDDDPFVKKMTKEE